MIVHVLHGDRSLCRMPSAPNERVSLKDWPNVLVREACPDCRLIVLAREMKTQIASVKHGTNFESRARFKLNQIDALLKEWKDSE